MLASGGFRMFHFLLRYFFPRLMKKNGMGLFWLGDYLAILWLL